MGTPFVGPLIAQPLLLSSAVMQNIVYYFNIVSVLS